MTTEANHRLNSDARVAIAALASDQYLPEPEGTAQVTAALKRAAQSLGWADDQRGPLANIVTPGSRVLIKPNFVLHRNQGPWGMEPMVTHQSLVKAAVAAALRAGAAEVLVGDAPIQSCDFDQLLTATELGEWSAVLQKSEPRFKGIRDFRRTKCEYVNGVRMAEEDLLPEDQFLLFDLQHDSLLEPITDGNEAFRVTCYDPRLMAVTHAPGRHRYLVAKDVMDADVVINLPKLKTHKKAGITCALKNLIGINGNKEYLPHHRLGGQKSGGDCYPGGSPVKRALEYVLDQQNTAASLTAGKVWHQVGTQLNRVLHLMGDNLGIEGSWSGNDTIWRTGLDLNRILLYGTAQGTMGDAPQRRVVHLVDAVVAGQGDGPLAPQPLPMGLILAGSNAAAVDWVGARLLGYDPQRVPIVREAFSSFKWPLTSFATGEVMLVGDWGTGPSERVLQSTKATAPVIYPTGWVEAACSERGRIAPEL